MLSKLEGLNYVDFMYFCDICHFNKRLDVWSFVLLLEQTTISMGGGCMSHVCVQAWVTLLCLQYLY